MPLQETKENQLPAENIVELLLKNLRKALGSFDSLEIKEIKAFLLEGMLFLEKHITDEQWFDNYREGKRNRLQKIIKEISKLDDEKWNLHDNAKYIPSQQIEKWWEEWNYKKANIEKEAKELCLDLYYFIKGFISGQNEPSMNHLHTNVLPMPDQKKLPLSSTDLIIPIMQQVIKVKAQAEQELKIILEPIKDVGSLYLIWKEDKSFNHLISEKLKEIYFQAKENGIPSNTTPSFHIVSGKKSKYLDIQWWDVNNQKHCRIGLGKLKDFESQLGLITADPEDTIVK